MSTNAELARDSRPAAAAPPSKHQLAIMIWIAVFPTLTVLNLALGDWLRTFAPVVRTLVLVTVAVPIVIYVLMPQLHRVRRHLLIRLARRALTPRPTALRAGTD
jgi:antibiotic biosynthesis monooxygenase (ABM) superfamily enzyme